MASYTIHTQVSSSRPVSMKAEKFSNLPCPYWCSESAGLSDTRTEKRVMTAATRSRPECAASERIPKLPVEMPTSNLRAVMPTAAATEFPATARFSARIESDENTADEPAICELSRISVVVHSTEYRVPSCEYRVPSSEYRETGLTQAEFIGWGAGLPTQAKNRVG